MKQFGISHTVSILPMSLFLIGLGIGPLLVGPLSEVHGILRDFRSPLDTDLPLRSEHCISGVVPRLLYLLLASSVCSQRRRAPVSSKCPEIAPFDFCAPFAHQASSSSSASSLDSVAPHSCLWPGVPSVTFSYLRKSGSECVPL